MEAEWILNTHVASAFALMGLFVCWHLYDRLRNKIYLLCALLNLAALGVTMSWAAFAATAIGTGYVAFRKSRIGQSDRGSIPYRMVMLVLAAAGIAVLAVFHGKSATLTDRFAWWSAAGELILRNPLTGSGPFEKLAPLHLSTYIRSPYAHNYILQMAAEYGVPAALFMAWFVIHKIKSCGPLILRAGLAAAFLHNAADFGLNIPGILLLFFILLSSSEETRPDGRGIAIKISTVGLVLATSVMVWTGWVLGAKPWTSFYLASRAQDEAAAGKMDEAIALLKKASDWDPLRTDLNAGLCLLYYERYQQHDSVHDLREALRQGNETLRKEPLEKIYYLRMKTLLEEQKRILGAH